MSSTALDNQVHVCSYMPENGQNFRELMNKQIGLSRDGCLYVGDIVQRGHQVSVYHCFSTTFLADSQTGSFAGNPEDILDARERLEKMLSTKLVPIPPR